MIELRWLQQRIGPTLVERERRLQWRERLGGVGMARTAIDWRQGAFGIQAAPDEGWTPWQDVPIVVEAAPEDAQQESQEPKGDDDGAN